MSSSRIERSAGVALALVSLTCAAAVIIALTVHVVVRLWP